MLFLGLEKPFLKITRHFPQQEVAVSLRAKTVPKVRTFIHEAIKAYNPHLKRPLVLEIYKNKKPPVT